MKKLEVIFLSEWLSNPYKTLLSKSLNKNKVEIKEYLLTIFFIPIVLKDSKPDILHLHALHPFLRSSNFLSKSIKFWLFVSQIFFLRLIGIKTVWTVHEWEDKLYNESSIISPANATIIGKIFHSFITHCQSTKCNISKYFKVSDQHVHLIPHGNYIDYYKNQVNRKEARTYLGIPNNSFVFLIFGGLYRYKGILEAIQAFKQVQESNIYLVITGKPSERGLKEEIENEIFGFENILFFSEYVLDYDVQIYMNACDCVVVSYKVFTTSGVAILAMSFGRICIAPRVGFFVDILGESGAFLYDSESSNGLLNAMKQAILNQNSIPSMENNNFILAKQWNWDYVAEATLVAYK